MKLIRSLAALAIIAGGLAASSTSRADANPAPRQLCAPAAPGTATCNIWATPLQSPGTIFTPPGTPPYAPQDLWSAYNLPALSGGYGQTVGIVDAYDDPTVAGDLALYRSTVHLPRCMTTNGCFRKVNQQGLAKPLPRPDPGWAAEISLDLDMVSAICPNCRILLVEASSASFVDLAAAENTAVAMGANVVSNSYSGPEFSGQDRYSAAYNHPGVVITAATGDNGTANGPNVRVGVGTPAVYPNVIAAGGTSLYLDPSDPRGWRETAWGQVGSGGAGSACSQYEPKPIWQTDTGCPRRIVADVSAVADPNTGVLIAWTAPGYPPGTFWQIGGTSVASPIIAGVYGLAANEPALFANGGTPGEYLYEHTNYSSDLSVRTINDVTSGANGSCVVYYFCHAVPGYDGPTGVGTPWGLGAF